MRCRANAWLTPLAAILFMTPIGIAQDTGKKPSSYMPVVIPEEFSAIVARMKAAKPEVMKRQMALLEERYAGATQGGKPFATFGGVEWQSAGFSNQDAELLLTRKFEVEEIARVYRVPISAPETARPR